MTHHYSVEIIKKKVFLKVTFRNGKFRKIEHLRGKIDRQLMDSLGKVIPVGENEISFLNKKWFKKINYEIEVKKHISLYDQMVAKWFDFYLDWVGVKPKYTGADGKALKQIAKYLRSQSTSEDSALSDWCAILDNWEYLSDFHKKQKDLKYINSKLNVIINELKKDTSNLGGTGNGVEL